MGFFYIRAKGERWYLRFEETKEGKRRYESVPKKNYHHYGFRADMSLMEARERVTNLNLERKLENRDIHAELRSSKRSREMKSLDNLLFPESKIQAFHEQIDIDAYGLSKPHVFRLHSQMIFVQKIMIELKLTPQKYKDNCKAIYRYLAQNRLSVDYGKKLIAMMNRWGYFISKQNGQFFEPIPQPKGRDRKTIATAQKGKKGVRRESEALTPDLLERRRYNFTEAQYNYLFIGVWFGLRPYEIDMTIDPSTWEITKQGNVQILGIYQTKLIALEEQQMWKYIPALFGEQLQALRHIRNGAIERPSSKLTKQVFQTNITLYGGRKGFVDLMLDRGQKLEDISLWLGHKSIETTWKFYKDKLTVRFTKTADTVHK